MTERQVRAYRDSDWAEWLRLTQALFPHHSADELSPDMRTFLARDDTRVFVIERPDGRLAGYVQAGSRPYADGCATTPVGYIEEWFVDPDVRRLGLGRALLAAAEAWALARGYSEMASDALLDNDVSHRAHQRSGYVEVERVVQFRKPLRRDSP